MNGQLLENIKYGYNSFKQRMISNITNQQIPRSIYPFEECYLIDESYINELEYYLSLSRFPNKEPMVFNSFKSVINYISNNINISLISKKLIEMIGFNKILMSCKTVLCYGGNNKLIIKFKDDIYNKSLLLFNFSNKIQISRNAYIIMNNKIESLYESILKNLYHQYIKEKIIISFEEYQNNNNFNINKAINTPNPNYIQNYNTNIYNNNIIGNQQLSFQKQLLSIFIYIFYYEKYLHENNNKINLFKKNEKYYLINPEWLKKFKEYYNYRNLYYSLKNNKKYNSVNYNNLDDNNINYIINEYYLNENVLNFKNNELSEYLKNISQLKCFLNKNFKKYEIFYLYLRELLFLKKSCV